MDTVESQWVAATTAPTAIKRNIYYPRSGGHILALNLCNLVWACILCNKLKWRYEDGLDTDTGELAALFHPKTQAWADHFIPLWDGKIRGMNPVGRATANRLRFNTRIASIRHRAIGYREGWWPG